MPKSTPTRPLLRVTDKGSETVHDEWTRITDHGPLPEGPALIPLERYLDERESLKAREGRIGVEVPGEVDEDQIASVAGEVDLIAVRVPKFADGRHYSTARLLRMRHGFKGELRATGDVLPDQLFYMRRVGYDAFELRADKSLETAQRLLDTFSVTYQPAEVGQPLFRRRA